MLFRSQRREQAKRNLGRRQQRPRQPVHDHQEAAAGERRSGDQAAMGRTDPPAHDMRHDEADKGDEAAPAHGHGGDGVTAGSAGC